MKWNKFRLKTTTEAEDIVSSMLMDLGIQGIEIEDKLPMTQAEKEQMFVDILPEVDVDDGIAYISFYLEEDDDKETILANVRAELEDMRAYVEVGSGEIEESQTEDVDWVNNYIDDILVIPSWEEVKPEDEGKMIVHIDPGTAFGTGKHETTQLCIRQLKKYVKEDTEILDVGCGSGILSIVALKLGASAVVGTDLDADCMTSTRENMEVNHLDTSLGTFYVGNLIDDEELQKKVGMEEYDIVVANILADVIIPMAPVIPRHLKKGGYFITSGIIDFKENEVKQAITEAGLKVVEINRQGEWINITAVKPDTED